ncbi:DDE family endonuclease [Mycena sanguinolenta]|uniref:DDE family endonuclease n=1 Tax=Mycena sanguinolenta TaxID=230812 RepID=A0A8H7DJ00_9AGAR|nr:DDE family endonuclease [Mycena sanguinolenta]
MLHRNSTMSNLVPLVQQADVARLLRISVRSVENILARYRSDSQGLSEPTLRVRGRRRILRVTDVDFLVGLIERTPDMYLYEMKAELRELCDVDVSRVAAQRDEEARTNFEIYMATTYRADQLLFVDEAACNRNTAKRGWGWALVGEEARRHDIYIRGVKCVVIHFLFSLFHDLSGILSCPLFLWMVSYVLAGSYTAATFNSFIDGLLDNMNPYPGPNSVIVMDNASIHKSAALHPMIEQRGMRLEYLPPYSPDYDPIEEGFSTLKVWIRAHRDYTDGPLAAAPNADSPYAMLWRAVFESMTADKAREWFAHAGYL